MDADANGITEGATVAFSMPIVQPTIPPHMTDEPYTAELIARYNTFTFFPRTREQHNAGFAAWARQVEESTRERLRRFGLEAIPEDVVRAVENLRAAEVAYMRRCVRARELAPGAYIVGPSNYLKRARPDKARKMLQIGMDEVDAARMRLQRAIGRYRPNQVISSDDPEALARLTERIVDMESAHARMLAANKILRQSIGDDEKRLQLYALGFGERANVRVLVPETGVGSVLYNVRNPAAAIRRLKERRLGLIRLRADADARAEFPGGVALDNVADNRLQITFDSKPDDAARRALKRNGFKWAPSVGAWQRMRGPYSRHSAGYALKEGGYLAADASLAFVVIPDDPRAMGAPEADEPTIPVSPNAGLE